MRALDLAKSTPGEVINVAGHYTLHAKMREDLTMLVFSQRTVFRRCSQTAPNAHLHAQRNLQASSVLFFIVWSRSVSKIAEACLARNEHPVSLVGVKLQPVTNNPSLHPYPWRLHDVRYGYTMIHRRCTPSRRFHDNSTQEITQDRTTAVVVTVFPIWASIYGSRRQSGFMDARLN